MFLQTLSWTTRVFWICHARWCHARSRRARTAESASQTDRVRADRPGDEQSPAGQSGILPERCSALPGSLEKSFQTRFLRREEEQSSTKKFMPRTDLCSWIKAQEFSGSFHSLSDLHVKPAALELCARSWQMIHKPVWLVRWSVLESTKLTLLARKRHAVEVFLSVQNGYKNERNVYER